MEEMGGTVEQEFFTYSASSFYSPLIRGLIRAEWLNPFPPKGASYTQKRGIPKYPSPLSYAMKRFALEVVFYGSTLGISTRLCLEEVSFD